MINITKIFTTAFVVLVLWSPSSNANDFDTGSVSKEYISSFSRTALEELNTFDYSDFKIAIEGSLDKNFTKKGKEGYINALVDSGNLSVLVNKKLKVDAIVSGKFKVESVGEKLLVVGKMRLTYSDIYNKVFASKAYVVRLVLNNVVGKGESASSKPSLKIESVFLQ